jgi:hypothetical protein
VKSRGTVDVSILLSGAHGVIGVVELYIFLLFPLRFALRMFFFFILVKKRFKELCSRYLELQLKTQITFMVVLSMNCRVG